ALTMDLHSRIVTGWISSLVPGNPRSIAQALVRGIGSQLVWDWTVVAILLVIVLRWERRPLASIGVKRLDRRDLLWVFGAAAISFVAPLVLPGRGFVK